jgi:hypothetical protein
MLGFVIIDVDTNQDHQLLQDIAEAATLWADATRLGRPSPYGWDATAFVRAGLNVKDVMPGEIPVLLVSHMTVADALGFHQKDASGKPSAVIYPALLDDVASQLAGVITHEIGEALIDPECARLALGNDGRLRALEISDAVETQNVPIKIASGKTILCSAYCTPAWFSAPAQLTGVSVAVGDGTDGMRPGEILPGGYMSYFDGVEWTQEQVGQKSRYRDQLATVGGVSRHERRVTLARLSRP